MNRQLLSRRVSVAVIAVAAALGGVLFASGVHMTPAVAAEEPQTSTAAPEVASRYDFADLAARVVPSIVSVYSTDVLEPQEMQRQMPVDPFQFFFGPNFGQPQGPSDQPMVRQSAGSGFFISKDGELLTNNHVIEGADKIEIQLDDRSTFDVEVVGRDPATDIAVLRVVKPDREFPVLPLGDSDALRVGEWVMAVGNPLNMDHTVTVGVVSAKGRVLGLSDNSFENFIQTDAAINFGNSGGPLVNVRGEAIGINTAINAGGQNLGFAVPINIAKRILPQLREHGKVSRGYLGAQIRDISPDIEKAFGLASRSGAFVEEVEPGHPADKAGLEHGDAIVAVDGQPVQSPRELIDVVSTTPPGETVKLGVIRDGKRLELKVKLEERPGAEGSEETAGQPGAEDASARIGIVTRDLSNRLRQVYGVGDDVSGVVITKVDPISPAGEVGLVPGDVITEANGDTIATTDALAAAVKAVAKGAYLRLYVYRPRADRSFFAILHLAD